MKKPYYYAVIILFCSLVTVLSLLHILMPDKKISVSERRALSSPPSLSGLYDGTFMYNAEKYAADQFPFREGFRAVHSAAELGLMRLDVNGIYSYKGYLASLDWEYSAESVKKSARKLSYAAEKFGDEIYAAIIPPKDYYINDGVHPTLDYDAVCALFGESFSGELIPIRDYLSLDCYYRTDSHWREEKAVPLSLYLCGEMGVSADELEWDENTIPGFRGVYSGQYALYTVPEKLVYLTNPLIESVSVSSFGGECERLYELEKAENSHDMYDIFLGGAVSVVEVYNPSSSSNTTLTIIRDSFASAVIPLLTPYFRKITAVDLRYITLDNALSCLGGDKSDIVLVLLSASSAKNSAAIRVDFE